MMAMVKRLLIVGILLAIVIGGIAIFFSRDPNPTSESLHLMARLNTLQAILNDGSRNSHSGNLLGFTSEARILITGEQANINSAFAAIGIKKIDKVTAAAEADGSTFTLLKNANLSGQYDPTYKSVLTQKLDSTAALIREVKNKSSNAKVKATLATSLQTFQVLQDKLAKF
jgi:hypothetical protein